MGLEVRAHHHYPLHTIFESFEYFPHVCYLQKCYLPGGLEACKRHLHQASDVRVIGDEPLVEVGKSGERSGIFDLGNPI